MNTNIIKLYQTLSSAMQLLHKKSNNNFNTHLFIKQSLSSKFATICRMSLPAFEPFVLDDAVCAISTPTACQTTCHRQPLVFCSEKEQQCSLHHCHAHSRPITTSATAVKLNNTPLSFGNILTCKEPTSELMVQTPNSIPVTSNTALH